MTREQAIERLELLWGTDATNQMVVKMIISVVRELGYDTFNDNALIRLAQLQTSEEEAQARRSPWRIG